MFKSLAIKALLGTGAIAAVAGGTGAIALNPNLAAAATPAAQGTTTAPKAAADLRRGVIIKLSDTEMTIERSVRDKTTNAVTKDDTTFELNAATKVFKAGDKTAMGREALKLGQRVRVRFAESNGQKVAKRAVILPDVRAGKVIAKGDNYIVIHTPEHGDVKVVVTDKTVYFTGRGKDRAKGTFAAIKVGDRAAAFGEEDSAHNFDAGRVHYGDPRVAPKAATPGAAAPAPAATPAQ